MQRRYLRNGSHGELAEPCMKMKKISPWAWRRDTSIALRQAQRHPFYYKLMVRQAHHDFVNKKTKAETIEILNKKFEGILRTLNY